MIIFTIDQCVDVDECANGNACGPGAVCRNVEGGYECSCPVGYEGDPRVGCRHHDGCARASCGRNAVCETLPGTYRCVCPPGFEGNPDVQCSGKPYTEAPVGVTYANSFSLWSNAYDNITRSCITNRARHCRKATRGSITLLLMS